MSYDIVLKEINDERYILALHSPFSYVGPSRLQLATGKATLSFHGPTQIRWRHGL